MFGDVRAARNERAIAVPVCPDFMCQVRAVYAFDRLFTGGIDLGDHDNIGAMKCFGELAFESRCARVSVGLKCNDNAAMGVGFLRGFECGFDFGGVVAVVVDEDHATDISNDRESPLHT